MRGAADDVIVAGWSTTASGRWSPPHSRRPALRADITPAYFSSRGADALEATAGFAEAWHDLRTLSGHARRLGLRMHIHAAEHLEQTQSGPERRGITPIRVLHETGALEAGALIAHGSGIVEDDLPLLTEQAGSTTVACCFRAYLKHALSPLTPVRELHGTAGAIPASVSVRDVVIASPRTPHTDSGIGPVLMDGVTR